MTKDEALKLALEAMGLAKHSHGVLLLSDPPQETWKTYQVDAALSKAITAIKAALEAPQRTWVGLTDEEIAQMGLNNYRKVVRETEAALKAKNT
jgi:hypothetical protein